MCGIVGQIGPGACDKDQLLKMMGMLTHRGPDEAGTLMGEGLAFGSLRLSIVDLKQGQQPMGTQDGRYWVVFNGEIFNHVELRRELEDLGHVFRTRCDTEVILEGFRQWGPSCLDRFNGQWAFALWDRDEQSYFLARDRFGIRPLFYSILPDGETLVFGSEIKALLVDDRIRRLWDFQALHDIFICWSCETDRTPIKSIQQLPPGSYMRISEGRFDVCKWWEIDYSPTDIDWSRPEESWCEEIRATLDEACRIRLRADVPVGTYLSGGLDSSIITFLSKSNHHPQLRTFSLGFSDASFDESDYQELVATHLGTQHEKFLVRREIIASNFKEAIWHAETPIHRTAPVPMMQLSKMVRSAGLKVVLTGEGADEIFGGYDQFKENKARRFWSRSPRSLWRKRLLDRLERHVPRTSSKTRAFWYAFYQEGLDQVQRPGYSHHLRWRNGMSLLPLLREYVAGDGHLGKEWIEQVEMTVPDDFITWDELSQAQYWEMRQFLAGYLLSSQGDRMSMANSIESRYPFLDVNVFELSRRIPPYLKLRVLQEKYILKKTFDRDLPRQIIERRKYPYRAPDALALYRGSMNRELLESLEADGVRKRGLFHVEAVSKLVNRIQNSTEPSARDNMALVLVLSSHIFQDLFIDSPMKADGIPRLTTSIDSTLAAVHQ